jgi:hypothetical protein
VPMQDYLEYKKIRQKYDTPYSLQSPLTVRAVPKHAKNTNKKQKCNFIVFFFQII